MLQMFCRLNVEQALVLTLGIIYCPLWLVDALNCANVCSSSRLIRECSAPANRSGHVVRHYDTNRAFCFFCCEVMPKLRDKYTYGALKSYKEHRSRPTVPSVVTNSLGLRHSVVCML